MEKEDFKNLLDETTAKLKQVKKESKNWLNETSYVVFSSTVDRTRLAMMNLRKLLDK